MAIPGQFPQFDPSAAGGRRPFADRPCPPAVVNAVRAMYAGAIVSVASTAVTVSSASGSTAAHLAGGLGLFGGVVNVGLWVWMAMANRAGHHWARVTATVFFGISTFGVILSLALLPVYHRMQQNLNQDSITVPANSAVSVGLSVVSFLVGLYATVMMWHKSAKPFYQPQLGYAPVGWPQPGTPPYGYPYPYPYPQVPGQQGQPGAPLAGQAPLPQGQPADPWQTPRD